MDINVFVLASVIDKNGAFWEILMEIYSYMKYLVPVLIVVLSSVDFVIAIAKTDEDIKKAQTKFIKRMVLGLVFFIIPVILDLVLSFGGKIGSTGM